MKVFMKIAHSFMSKGNTCTCRLFLACKSFTVFKDLSTCKEPKDRFTYTVVFYTYTKLTFEMYHEHKHDFLSA